MNKHWSVVVGVDFSASSRRAVELATAVSARAAVPLQLLHVWNVTHMAGSAEVLPEVEPWIAEQKVLLGARLDDWAAEARKSGVEASSRVVEGVASRVISEVARSSGAGLVVVGRRGSANLSHVLLGSVSERVVHTASCPVLVVPEQTPPRSPQRLMVGIDFSHASMDAFRAALRLVENLGASRGLVVANVRSAESESWLETWSDYASRGDCAEDQAALKRWAGVSDAGRVSIEARVLEGKTEQLLLSAAESEACDWLVLGRQGRTALAALMMGSTTDRILKLADRPVLVVPATSDPAGEATRELTAEAPRS